MKKSSAGLRNKTIAVSFGAILVVSSIFVADAFAFQRNITRTGVNGLTSSKNVTTSRTSQGYNRNTTYTGPQGNSASRSAQGQWDAATQTWNRSATINGPNGNSTNSSSSATRTTTGYNRNTSVTGPQGNSGTRNVSGSWDPVTKTWTKTATSTR